MCACVNDTWLKKEVNGRQKVVVVWGCINYFCSLAQPTPVSFVKKIYDKDPKIYFYPIIPVEYHEQPQPQPQPVHFILFYSILFYYVIL